MSVLSMNKTRRYIPLRGLTSSSCRGLWPLVESFFAHRAKTELLVLFLLILGHFSVVPLVTFGSNLINLKQNPKNPRKISKEIQRIQKSHFLKPIKNPYNTKNCKIISKNSKSLQSLNFLLKIIIFC